jgi:hypothetical protein
MKPRFTYEIIQDQYPSNPRKEFDHVGTMVCWHRRYNLGDEQPKVDPEEYLDDLAWKVVNRNYPSQLMEKNRDAILNRHYLTLPVYLYDHSGITTSINPFSCPWDSCQVGFIYCTQKQIDDEWGGDREKAEEYLKGEVKEYDKYLTDDVWGYKILDSKGEEVDSCWGFYGYEYAEQEARDCVKGWEESTPQQADMFEEAV